MRSAKFKHNGKSKIMLIPSRSETLLVLLCCCCSNWWISQPHRRSLFILLRALWAHSSDVPGVAHCVCAITRIVPFVFRARSSYTHKHTYSMGTQIDFPYNLPSVFMRLPVASLGRSMLHIILRRHPPDRLFESNKKNLPMLPSKPTYKHTHTQTNTNIQIPLNRSSGFAISTSFALLLATACLRRGAYLISLRRPESFANTTFRRPAF